MFARLRESHLHDIELRRWKLYDLLTLEISLKLEKSSEIIIINHPITSQWSTAQGTGHRSSEQHSTQRTEEQLRAQRSTVEVSRSSEKFQFQLEFFLVFCFFVFSFSFFCMSFSFFEVFSYRFPLGTVWNIQHSDLLLCWQEGSTAAPRTTHPTPHHLVFWVRAHKKFSQKLR